MSEYRGNSGQPLHTMLGYADSSRSPSTLSSPSRPAGRSQVYEHADFPGREFSSWQGKNRQNNEQGTVALPGSQGVHSTAAQHGEAEATDTSTNSAPLRSGQTGHLTYRFPGQSQVEDTSETATRKHRRLLDPARAPIGKGQNSVINFLSGLGRARSQGDDSDRRRPSHYSDGIQRSQSSHTRLQTREESHSSLGAPVLSRPSSACSHISLTSSIETIRSTLSFDVDLTQADASEEPENAGSTSPPVPTSPFVASSSLVGVEEIVYGPSTPSQDDLNEGDREVDVPSGEQRHASSSQSGNRGSARGAQTTVEHMHSQFDQGDDTLSPLPLPQPLSPLLVASTLPTPTHFWTQNIRQSPTDAVVSSPREVWTTSPPSHFSFEMSSSTASGLGLLTDVASPRLHPLPQSPAAQTFSESPVDRSVRSTDAQSPTRDTESSRDSPQHDNASSLYLSAEDTSSIGTRPIDCGSRSHHNVPLPPSPVSSVANSIIRLQFQPAHRHSPRRSLYPSLAGEDAEPLSPSGLFGLPTPGLSPMQAPAVIRSPAMDPRSPVPSQMRIPGDIMGLLGAFLDSGHDHAHASFIFVAGPSFLVVLRLPRIILEGFPDYHGKR